MAIDSSLLIDLAPPSIKGQALVSAEQFAQALGGRQPVVGAQAFREFVVQAPGGMNTQRLGFLLEFLKRHGGQRSYVTADGLATELQTEVAAGRAAYRGNAVPRLLSEGDARVAAEAVQADAVPVLTTDAQMARSLRLLGAERGNVAQSVQRPQAAPPAPPPAQAELPFGN